MALMSEPAIFSVRTQFCASARSRKTCASTRVALWQCARLDLCCGRMAGTDRQIWQLAKHGTLSEGQFVGFAGKHCFDREEFYKKELRRGLSHQLSSCFTQMCSTVTSIELANLRGSARRER